MIEEITCVKKKVSLERQTKTSEVRRTVRQDGLWKE